MQTIIRENILFASTLHSKYNRIMKNLEKDFSHLTLSNQLCHRLYVTANAITRASRPLLERLNLTYPQYVVMMALWEADNLSVGELREKTQIDSGCLSVMLKKMMTKNIIELATSDSDKRKKKVKLTTKGKSLKKVACEERKKMIEKQKNLLTDEESDSLIYLLDKLKEGLIDYQEDKK